MRGKVVQTAGRDIRSCMEAFAALCRKPEDVTAIPRTHWQPKEKFNRA